MDVDDGMVSTREGIRRGCDQKGEALIILPTMTRRMLVWYGKFVCESPLGSVTGELRVGTGDGKMVGFLIRSISIREKPRKYSVGTA